MESVVLLQGYVVPETDGGEGDEAVVEGMEKGPTFIVGEGSCSYAQGADAGEEADDHHVGHGDFRPPQAHAFLGFVQQEPDEGVDAFAQALEHHQGEGDAQKRIPHAERFPSIRTGGGMAITLGRRAGKDT